jgi:hypothetical protein
MLRVEPLPLQSGRPAQAHATSARISSRRSAVLGWLGILAGAAVYVAALEVPLDDAAPVIVLALMARGGCTIHDPVPPPLAAPGATEAQAQLDLRWPRRRHSASHKPAQPRWRRKMRSPP